VRLIGFSVSRRRKAREAAQLAKDQETALRYEREEAYQNFRRAAVERHIEQHLPPEDLATSVAAQVLRRRAEYQSLPEQTIREIAERDVRIAIAEDLHLPSFDQFCSKLDRGEAIGAS
jgi:predicted secreted protein